MEGWGLLGEVLAVLSAAFVFGAVLQRLGFSALIGYLLAGVLLGPHATAVVGDADAVAVLAELGVGMLLFSIGLEFSWRRLMATGRRALVAGVLQVIVTLALIALCVRLAGVPTRVGLVIGAAFALSSTASVLRVLAARSALDTVYGRHALGILLVQDIAVIPLVLMVDTLGFDGPALDVLLRLGKTIGFALALGAGFWVVAIKLLPRLLLTQTLTGNRELALLLAAVTGIGSIVAAHAAGLSPAVGAFVAGMLLAECSFATQIRADIGGLRTLLVTIFFVSVGMLADPAWIGMHLPLMAGVVALVVVGKALIVAVLLASLRVAPLHAIATGLCLAQAGEFAFVLAGQAYPGILGEDALQLVAGVCVTTLFLTPPMVRRAAGVATVLVAAAHRIGVLRPGPDGESATSGSMSGHVIVVGLGPAARIVVRRAREQKRPVIAIDLSGGALERARALGVEAMLGDATYPEVLEHAGLERAAVLVVTVPDASTAALVVRLARRLAPHVRVLVRARYSRAAPELERAGATVVLDEEKQMGQALADLLGS